MEWVTTEKFWALMCRRGFIRTSKHFGYLAGTVYYTTRPPEEDSIVMARAMDESIRRLGLHLGRTK